MIRCVCANCEIQRSDWTLVRYTPLGKSTTAGSPCPGVCAGELPPATPGPGPREPYGITACISRLHTHIHTRTATSHSRSIMEAGQIRHLAKQGLLDETIPTRPTAPSSPWRLGAWAAPSPRTWRAAPPGRRVGRRAPWAASRGSKGNWPLLQWDRQGLATRRHGF